VKDGLWEAVVERDARFIWGLSNETRFFSIWRREQGVICVVPMLDPDNPYTCAGKQEVDHVKERLGLSMKAPDDEQHLVAMCQEHNTWHPPRKQLRQAERIYLSRYGMAVLG